MSRAVITHFDGDPFLLNFWLLLYEKYWRGECDVVYMSIFYNPELIPAEAIAFNKELLLKYPEIKVTWLDEWKIPEMANQQLLATVTEDYIGLIESDGFIYGRGIVDQCFRLLEDNQDLVAPPWGLIDEPYFKGDLQTQGYMRCFLFAKKSLLDKVELDFMPKTIPAKTRLTKEYSTAHAVELDCFGWISWQLALLRPKTTVTPNNILTPDNIMKQDSNFKWVHVRQMQSSALGLGGGEYGFWTKASPADISKRVLKLFNAEWPGGNAEYIHIKALAFRLLFWDLADKTMMADFAAEYRQMLELVIDYYAIPREQIYEIKGYYKGLFNL